MTGKKKALTASTGAFTMVKRSKDGPQQKEHRRQRRRWLGRGNWQHRVRSASGLETTMSSVMPFDAQGTSDHFALPRCQPRVKREQDEQAIHHCRKLRPAIYLVSNRIGLNQRILSVNAELSATHSRFFAVDGVNTAIDRSGLDSSGYTEYSCQVTRQGATWA
ncbi:hypothetical protein GALMADRAFT_206094 [Galerina marginata CBS 339.88]|uniref:Uncharacterized protein n=1 Tax=Galerina marginata (strain CBS 339.88) TaxID=685588 RepID=A0A067TX32_GALM3|nr:hypothetical protein GALMADRAFT_206094 [Galerina marginata CBS 339.88]